MQHQALGVMGLERAGRRVAEKGAVQRQHVTHQVRLQAGRALLSDLDHHDPVAKPGHRAQHEQAQDREGDEQKVRPRAAQEDIVEHRFDDPRKHRQR